MYWNKNELADKPGSVTARSGHDPEREAAVIHLGRPSPDVSSSLPESDADHTRWIPIWPCSGRGLPCHACYQARGALLPHPFTLTVRDRGDHVLGGLLSAALSVGSRPPGVTWRPCPVEPGLSSRGRLSPAASDCLASSRSLYASMQGMRSTRRRPSSRRDLSSAHRGSVRRSGQPAPEIAHRPEYA